MQHISSPTNSLANLAGSRPTSPDLTASRLKILIGLVTQMYLCCAPAQLPETEGIVTMARAWTHVLTAIPDAYLQASYERAMAAHAASPRRTFPMGATDIAHAWTELGEELAYARQMQPSGAPALPAAPRKPLTESNSLPGVLTELAHAWGEWSGGERGAYGVTLTKVLEWANALGTAYPDVPPAAMRLQLQKLRLAGAGSLGGAVHTLLTEAAPAPEGEAI